MYLIVTLPTYTLYAEASMASKKLDDGRAFRLARVLKRHIDNSGDVEAIGSINRVVQCLAVKVAITSSGAANLKPGTVALAIKFENPELSNAEVARRVGCSVKTLERDERYRRVCETLQLGRDKFATQSR